MGKASQTVEDSVSPICTATTLDQMSRPASAKKAAWEKADSILVGWK